MRALAATPLRFFSSPGRVALTCLYLFAFLSLAWVWFYLSVIAEALPRPLELAGAVLFWPFITGLHLLVRLPVIPRFQPLAGFVVPSFVLASYYLSLIAAAQYLTTRLESPLGRRLGLASILVAYIAPTVGAYVFFHGFPT